ncbi:Hint domain-containing protein [Antarctobacter jejuensis]|uniref:Hint domain-containing protein n=1 Tax=Antarctobacter jejuensis TaxID=1439938 RepID=UPI003FD1C925
MPNYSIWVQDENDLTISGGGQLDGVTQGDGSHLVGLTITLGTQRTAINIRDNDDDFRDNDGQQQLDGAQEVNGVTYADGTVVEAEYSFTVTDGTNTYTLIGFNVRDSSPPFATIEGVAFVGDPGSWPPSGVPLTITGAAEGPNYQASEYVAPICFAAGTLIETPQGQRPIERLRPGDRVTTLNGRKAVVRWAGRRRYCPASGQGPIRFRAGAIGNTRDLVVSPQHRIFVSDWRVMMLFGLNGALVAAQDLVDGVNVLQEDVDFVTYVHLLFDRHEILISEGAATESLYPGPCALGGLEDAARRELLDLFPELSNPRNVLPPVAPSLKRHEARLLMTA